MKLRSIAATLVLLFLASLAVAQKGYTSPDKKFTIDFPGTPEVSSKQAKTNSGDAFTITFYEYSTASVEFTVAVADYSFALTDDDIRKGYEGITEGKKVLFHKEGRVQGQPSILFLAQDDKIREAVLLTKDGNRLYAVMFAASVKDADNIDGSIPGNFVTSFIMNDLPLDSGTEN